MELLEYWRGEGDIEIVSLSRQLFKMDRWRFHLGFDSVI